MKLNPKTLDNIRSFIKGKSPKEVAGEEGVNISTINSRMEYIRKQMGVRNNMQLVHKMTKENII